LRDGSHSWIYGLHVYLHLDNQIMRAGAKLGHSAPRKRCSAAE
jgi:hypothetical protein